MDNLRRAILLITIVVLIGAAVMGFMLALSNEGNTEENTFIKLLPEGEKYDSEATPDPSATEKPIEDMRSTSLFVITASNGKDADLILTVSADYAAGKMAIILYPVDVFVSIKNTEGASSLATLSDIYASGGLDALADAVSGILSIPVSGRLSFGYDAFSKLLNYFTSRDEGVVYTAPASVNAIVPDGTKTVIDRGQPFYVGNNSAKLLSFYRTKDNVYDSETVKFYDGTRIPQNKVAATFADAFISQKLTGEIDQYYITNYANFFSGFLEMCTGKVSDGFPDRLIESEALFKSDNIEAYMISSVENPNGRGMSFDGTLKKLENLNGIISEQDVSGDALGNLIKSLY